MQKKYNLNNPEDLKELNQLAGIGLKEHLDKLKPIQPSKLTLSIFEDFINKLNNENRN